MNQNINNTYVLFVDPETQEDHYVAIVDVITVGVLFNEEGDEMSVIGEGLYYKDGDAFFPL